MMSSVAPKIDIACENCAMHALCKPIRLGSQEFDLLRTVITRRRPVKRGEFLYRRGDPFRSIFAVCNGSVKTGLCSSDEGNEQIYGFALPGELFGAEAIGKHSYPGDAVALTNSRVCEIPFKHIEDVSEHVPAIQTELVRLVCNELQNSQRLAASLLGKHTAEQKLAAFLLNLSERFREHGFSPTRFKLGMTRIDIGKHIGVATETVTRIFKRFQQQGLISTLGSSIQLNDSEQLRSIANGA